MTEPTNFIENIIHDDLESGKITALQTRFPPEPNGYLHVGHAKSMCINFGTAKKYGGKCNLFFDDTNPSKEKTEFVEAIKEDINWLGFTWAEIHYASDFFPTIYELAVKLIKEGKAYVSDETAEEIRMRRGTLTEPGEESPFRNRSVEENLTLFEEMKAGKYADGEKVLRAKIDMASPNINMRDPVIYRILRATHHRTGDTWCIYPMYDYAHPICDAMQGVTHSLCTLEFEDHRPLYNWVTENCGFEKRPRQIEFARLNIENTMMSKRYLKKMVEENFVEGWSDPRMPTLSGIRNRGIPPEALIDFCERVGVCKANSEVEAGYLDAVVRDYLNVHADRAMVVKNPLKVKLLGAEAQTLAFEYNPGNPEKGTREITFSDEIYIDADDFSLNPPPKYHRLKKDGYVRLKNAYIIKYEDVVLDAEGSPVELICSVVPGSKSGNDESGIKCKGVIQWVDAKTCVDMKLRTYRSLLLPAEYAGQDFSERLNKESMTETLCKAEAYLNTVSDGERFQLMRMGYYKKATDKDGNPVLSEIVSLKDNFNAKK